MSRLALYLLGPPRVELAGEELHIPRRKAVALLTYLALERGRHSRDSLAALLWPEYGQSRARADLRRTLSLLNRTLGGEWLTADRETAGLNPDADLWLDVDQFRQHLAACDTHAHPATEPCSDCLPLLEEAVALYRDHFLVGFTLRDSPSFDEFQFFQTEGLKDQLASALERLVRWHSDQSEYELAIEHARRWLALDPLHEPVHRHLMELYAQAGRHSAALRQYRTCLRVLEEELDVPPSVETTALYERIRAERARPPEAEVAAPPSLPPAPIHLPAFLIEEERPAAFERAVFVARERELAQLDGYLDTALGGQGQVVFVTGGPGRGKTALMHEFARRAMEVHPDLLVASGNCHAHSGVGDPYVPFCEVMGMLTGDVEARWRAGEVTHEHAQRLWAALPLVVQALLDRGPHLFDIFVSGTGLLSRATAAAADGAPWLESLREWVERPGARSDDLEQAQIFQQLINVLRTLAEAHPLLLTLDDLQWADTASISLMFHLGRRLEGCRVLILCAYRPEEVALGRPELVARADRRVSKGRLDRHPLEQALTEFKRQSGDVWVDLTQADETQGRRFVDAFLDTEPNRLGEGFREALFRRTGGHPLFTVELLRTLQEQEGLVKDEQGRWVEGPGLDWEKSPARVEAVIEARVGRLGEELRDMLAVASVEGERFTAQVVAEVQDIAERELLRVLSRELGARHRLVREAGETRIEGRFLSRYQFFHTLFQSYLYNMLSAGERRLLHGEIGPALERLWGDQTDEIAARLARHYFQAGHREKAVAFSLRAAHRARLGYADEEARAFYQQAVAIAAGESIARDTVELTKAELHEAPMLAELVASGELPAVEERMPVRGDIRVIIPVDGIGQYGGTWHNVSPDSSLMLIRMILYDPPTRWKADYTGYEPGLLKWWEVSGDGTRITWRFRKGVRWSDGAPFTTDDLRFWWEDMATDPDVGFIHVPEWGWKADGTPMDVSFPDDYTMVMEWETPQYVTVFHVAQGFWVWENMMKPRHYLEQFHPRYTEDASYSDLELADRWWQTPGYPTLYAWTVESVAPDERTVLVRNPYYWKVDVEGNQLPYIDRLDITIVPDKAARVLEASQGKYTASFRASGDPKDIPFLTERARAGGYHLHRGAVSGAGGWPCWIVNQDFYDPSLDNWEEIRDLLRDKRFRRALSHAMDRQRIIDAVWDGIGTPQQGTISPQSWHFASPEGQSVYENWANAYIDYDPDLAKRLLDEAGLVDADGDGWRELPSGASFQLDLNPGEWGMAPIGFEATECFAADLRAVGIESLIQIETPEERSSGRFSPGKEGGFQLSAFMLTHCHVAELDTWTYPAWIFPVGSARAWPLESKWRVTGGAEGLEPTGAAKALLEIYDRGLAEADMNKRHELVWEAIRIHIEEGPFFIGACGDQFVPVVIADNFRGVPDLVILGPMAPGTPGNLHPEQFWIEQ